MTRLLVVLTMLLMLVSGTARAAPGNDDFASAADIRSIPATFDVDTANASLELLEPSQGSCTGFGRTVWFRYVATQDTFLTASTAGSDFAVAILAYGGESFDNLRQLSCDYTGGPLGGEVHIGLRAGKTVYFQVGGRSCAFVLCTNTDLFAEAGRLVLTVNRTPDEVIHSYTPPLNDDRASAASISSMPTRDYPDVYSALREQGEPTDCVRMIDQPGGPHTTTVWYRYVASTDTTVQVRTQRMFGGAPIGLYEAIGGDLRWIACGTEDARDHDVRMLNLEASASHTYFIQVAGDDYKDAGDPTVSFVEVE